MGYASLRQCLDDLAKIGQLRVVEVEVDPYLELGSIQRRACRAGGPALLFTRVRGCEFPALANLFGTLERARYVLRHGLATVERLIELKVDPAAVVRQPWRFATLPVTGLHAFPIPSRQPPVAARRIALSQLPQVTSWPGDGGPFITLPQVYSEHPGSPGVMGSNLGMYRIQLAGNAYRPDHEVGLHYQLHRGIGVHHAAALELDRPFRVNVFVGGPPALTLAAVMPLPEGLPELLFAGLLGGRGVRLGRMPGQLPFAAEADFVVMGKVSPQRLLPEGPFGDHLGYYSLEHDFPVLEVEHVLARRDAIWPFTTVGRPPQEDSVFGKLIHELTAPLMPTVLAGVHAVHAVDEAGVHPLLLAQASERYEPYRVRQRPQELLTCANAILGQGQLSLAKFLLMVAREDDPHLDIHDLRAFFSHLLCRVDWRVDLHFHTQTTIDTLDYSGSALNQGSKLVVAAVGQPRRQLPVEVPRWTLPGKFGHPRVCGPGILALTGPAYSRQGEYDQALLELCEQLPADLAFPLVVVGDDSDFLAADFANFLWATFTRANPAADLYGCGAFVHQKHWGCRGPLVIDARTKP
ncbi:MAG: UbiD family decarboxylase, partial [Candidatus Eremiobacteraeota bacterium]|nr:UbiD family decarboxylase [Candidatus Eremiobacteraeota bacterium]